MICFISQEPPPFEKQTYKSIVQDGIASIQLEAASFVKDIKTDKIKREKDSKKTSKVVFILKKFYFLINYKCVYFSGSTFT